MQAAVYHSVRAAEAAASYEEEAAEIWVNLACAAHTFEANGLKTVFGEIASDLVPWALRYSDPVHGRVEAWQQQTTS